MIGKFIIASGIAVIALFGLKSSQAGSGGKRASTIDAVPDTRSLDTASFAAGCFWHVEDTFRSIEGVVSTEVGYAGGTMERPKYRDVCSNETGHAETVNVRFDPAKVSYKRLLDVFFEMHDPTSVDRQGPDLGSQYRSVIFYHTPAQRSEALAYTADLERSHRFGNPIATQIVPATSFWRAEDYHQQYYEKQGRGTE